SVTYQMEECGEVKEKERYSYAPELQWDPQVRDYLCKAYGHHHFHRISDSLT
ncbi:hypothetical protein KI387_026939, partial [Taxus chinensis]